jgi:hypothetical protein
MDAGAPAPALPLGPLVQEGEGVVAGVDFQELHVGDVAACAARVRFVLVLPSAIVLNRGYTLILTLDKIIPCRPDNASHLVFTGFLEAAHEAGGLQQARTHVLRQAFSAEITGERESKIYEDRHLGSHRNDYRE